MTALLGGYELWVVAGIALLLFGHRIPGMARSLGSGIVEFKKGLKGDAEESSPPPQVGSPPAGPADRPPNQHSDS